MGTDRRTVVKGVAASTALTLSSRALTSSARGLTADELFVAARREADGTFAAAIFSREQGDIATVPLPARGHDAVFRPLHNECVLFARRPGNFAVAFSSDRSREPLWFSTSPDRHFYGHGVFSRNGTLLYSTENEIETGRGIIGVRDATDGYRQLAALPSHGVGPHDIAMMPDGKILVVANGGIETHPDSGRTPLNLASMEPSLAYIDTRNGDLVGKHTLPRSLHQLSIRHLAVTADGTVVFGCQNKGAATEQPSLVGTLKPGKDIQLVDMPPRLSRNMRAYVSSIATDCDGAFAVATSARGSRSIVIDVRAAKVVAEREIRDVSGVSKTRHSGEFLLTDGYGGARTVDQHGGLTANSRNFESVNWDNHVAPYGLWQ